jgi:hypothetical protein
VRGLTRSILSAVSSAPSHPESHTEQPHNDSTRGRIFLMGNLLVRG